MNYDRDYDCDPDKDHDHEQDHDHDNLKKVLQRNNLFFFFTSGMLSS